MLGLLAALALATSAAFASGGPGDDNTAFGYGKNVHFARTLGFCNIYHGNALRTCLTNRLVGLVAASHDSAHELPRIDAYVAKAGGFLQANCHGLMHGVGRRYGAIVHLKVGRLLDYLPRTNNANCSAGFGHGLLMYLAPQIGSLTPEQAVKTCRGASTRYERYSCIHGFGHAYMRLYAEQLPFALHACRLLGPDNAPDCAAGAFHDYWIAVSGVDQTKRPKNVITSPSVLCTKESGGFVRGCWYRALLEHPPKGEVRTPRAVLRLCRALSGIQHESCITAVVLVSSPSPFVQMQLCVGLRRPEAADCIRGVRVPDLADSPPAERLRLIRQCAGIYHPAQAACYRWLGTALNVVTNGKFEQDGCDALRYAATRDDCNAGAEAYEGPLVTFA